MDSGRYQMERTDTHASEPHRYGKTVHTVWDFTTTARPATSDVLPPYQPARVSDPNSAAWQPVIFLHYDLPLAPDNTAPAGLPIWFTVRASAGKPGSAADVAGLSLRASFDDGKTWAQPWLLQPVGNGEFRVLLSHPRLDRTTGAVTLQTRTWDRTGNSVTQTVSRAYGLADLWHRDLTRPAV